MGLIRTTYEIITEESAAEYDVAERGWKDEEGTEYTVDEAIELVRGCEPSSSEFHVGVWYTMYGDMDMYTGEHENESYHLVKGTWTEEEERRIYEGVTRRHARECMSVSDSCSKDKTMSAKSHITLDMLNGGMGPLLEEVVRACLHTMNPSAFVRHVVQGVIKYRNETEATGKVSMGERTILAFLEHPLRQVSQDLRENELYAEPESSFNA